MKSKRKLKDKRRKKIHRRVRIQIQGTEKRPRLNVYKSNKHIYTQLVDDLEGHTLAAASTLTPDLREEFDDETGVEKAKAVGEKLAELAKENGIEKAVFDRSGYKYHGQVKAVAEGAREGGLDL